MSTVADGYQAFTKQLVCSDLKLREKALKSLSMFLSSSNHTTPLTHSDLLKLWKSLFFMIWHSDRAKTQARNISDLVSLVGPLPDPVCLLFLQTFWETMTREWPSIDALRMDKFMRLVRRFVFAGFQQCLERGSSWATNYAANLVLPKGPLHQGEQAVSHGLRYHVLDVWVDELLRAIPVGEDDPSLDGDDFAIFKMMIGVVEGLARGGRTKVIRDRAQAVLDDDRLRADPHQAESDTEKDGFAGFED